MPRGRMTKLTPALQTAIVNAVAAGVPVRSASLLAGIDEVTFFQWLSRGEGRFKGRPPKRIYVDFVQAIARARSQDEARRVARINQAGQGGAILNEKKKVLHRDDGTVQEEIIEQRRAQPDWQADAWHLERSRPESWGRRDRIDVTVIRREAERLAAEYGLEASEVDELIAEAEAVAVGWEAPRALPAGNGEVSSS